MTVRLEKWTLGVLVAAAALSSGAGCGGDDDDGGFDSGGTSNTGGVSSVGGVGANPGTGGDTGAGSGDTGGGGSSDGLGEELVNETGWVDGVNGIQGSFYGYGDGITCTVPEGNPCAAEGCCLAWATVVDSTYASWGCGIGLELNSDGADPAVKSPYTGTDVVGFQVTVTGDVPGIRLGYTQQADTTDTVSPFAIEATGANTYDVLFSETTCPSWGADQGCVDDAVAASSHDLQLQVVGGEAEASGSLCITSIKPILAQ